MRISSWTSNIAKLAIAGAGLSVAAALLPAAPAWAAGASPVPGVPLISDNPATVTNLPGQAPPMTAQMLAADAAKIASAQGFYSALAAATTTRQGTTTVSPMALSSKLLAATQQTQQQGTWCGPASVSESLNQVPGASHLTQAQAATALGTNSTGTNWSGGPTGPTGYPVVDVMNAHVPAGDAYTAHPVGSVTSTEIANYENVLVYDVYNFNHPLIGDQYIVSSSKYTLAGETPPKPGQLPIYHWWNIRGYGTASLIGDTTYYEDSAWTAYGSTSATAVVTMVSGRGVVW